MATAKAERLRTRREVVAFRNWLLKEMAQLPIHAFSGHAGGGVCGPEPPPVLKRHVAMGHNSAVEGQGTTR
jgi:hypothetical protein